MREDAVSCVAIGRDLANGSDADSGPVGDIIEIFYGEIVRIDERECSGKLRRAGQFRVGDDTVSLIARDGEIGIVDDGDTASAGIHKCFANDCPGDAIEVGIELIGTCGHENVAIIYNGNVRATKAQAQYACGDGFALAGPVRLRSEHAGIVYADASSEICLRLQGGCGIARRCRDNVAIVADAHHTPAFGDRFDAPSETAVAVRSDIGRAGQAEIEAVLRDREYTWRITGDIGIVEHIDPYAVFDIDRQIAVIFDEFDAGIARRRDRGIGIADDDAFEIGRTGTGGDAVFQIAFANRHLFAIDDSDGAFRNIARHNLSCVRGARGKQQACSQNTRRRAQFQRVAISQSSTNAHAKSSSLASAKKNGPSIKEA